MQILDKKKGGWEGGAIYQKNKLTQLRSVFISSEQALPGEHGDGPIFALITKNLAEVLAEAQAETILICTMAKHRGAHSL